VEVALTEVEARALFEAVPGSYLGLRRKDSGFVVVAVTDAYLRESGRARADVIGRPLVELVPEPPLAALERAADGRPAQGGPATAVAGGDPLVLLRVEATGSTACARDAGSDALRLLVASIEDYAVFLLDPSGLVVSWNPGAERLKGYRADEIIGRHFSIFYPREEAASGKCDRELEQAATRGRYDEEGWRVRKDGSRFWARVVITPVRDGRGRLVGFAKITSDLSERVHAEAERVRLAQAQEAIRLRDEFLSIASHELKTPLTTLQLQVNALQRAVNRPDGPDVARTRRRLAVVDNQLQRLTRLINDLLDVSRATSAGPLPLQPVELDLAALTREVAARVADDLAAAGCELVLALPPSLRGRWDRLRLERVLVNLLVNASKYGAGRPVELSLARDGDRVRLSVRDHGIGIALADQERIFERFARAVPSQNYGGLGLGLWIVRQFVDALEGRVWVVSAPGQGALFTVELPLEPRPGDGAAVNAGSEKASP
jgi:PAS domain S-box-containing protein